MARIKLGIIAQDIRGSIGQFTYSIWKTGVNVIRSKAAVISNPASPKQAQMRCNIAALAKDWFDTLDVAERAAWETWALTKPGMGNGDGGIMTVIKGNNGIMSGYNAYILANQWLESAGLPNTTVAPLGATPPTPPTALTVAWTTPNVVVTWIDPLIMKAGAVMRIWAVSRNKMVFRQKLASIAAGAKTASIASFYGAQGVAVPFAGSPCNLVIQMDCVDADGTKSGPSMVKELAVTNP